MSLFETFIAAAALFSPFVVGAAALAILRWLGVRTEGGRGR